MAVPVHVPIRRMFGRYPSKRPIKSPRLEPPRYINMLDTCPSQEEGSEIYSQETDYTSNYNSPSSQGWYTILYEYLLIIKLLVVFAEFVAPSHEDTTYPDIEQPRRDSSKTCSKMFIGFNYFKFNTARLFIHVYYN